MEDLIGEGRLTDIDFEAIESAATGDTDPEPSAFAQRVDREGRRRGFPEAQRRVILGDGAAWIWNIAGERGRDARAPRKPSSHDITFLTYTLPRGGSIAGALGIAVPFSNATLRERAAHG